MIDFVRDCLMKAGADPIMKPTASFELMYYLQEQCGFEGVGSGAYANVLEHKDYPGMVIKIEHKFCNRGQDWDTSNKLYMQFCAEHQHLEWVPKIYHMHQNFEVQMAHNNVARMHLYVMEKLQPIITNELNLEFDPDIYLKAYTFQKNCIPLSRRFQHQSKRSVIQHYKLHVEQLRSEWYPDITSKHAKVAFEHKHELSRIRKDLMRFFWRNETCAVDFQMCNMMIRPGTTQIVFTDPAS